jgi:hypothetical protein
MRFVYPANPIRLNRRLTIQQGVFLAPGDVTLSFENNIKGIPNYQEHIKKIVIDNKCKKEVLCKLYVMNINSATLFPGLDGFARSLREKSSILNKLPKLNVKELNKI